jgi:HNH endonuclease
MIDSSTPKQCVRCGQADARLLDRDHIVPRAEGGSDEPSNLQWLCCNCHRLKTIDDCIRIAASLNQVTLLDDGRVEVVFGRPIPMEASAQLMMILERFRLSRSTIAAVARVGHAFVRREELERNRDEAADLFVAARTSGAQEGLQFGEREFDRIEVGTVRRQEPKVRAQALDGGADLWLLMGREVVEHDDIPAVQGRREHLLDVRQETGTIDRPVEDGGRAQAVEA